LECIDLEIGWWHLGNLISETLSKKLEGVEAKIQFLNLELSDYVLDNQCGGL
jgi:hypothetical protein